MQGGRTVLTPDQLPPEVKTWIKVYPLYFDSTVSSSDGRRLNKQYCVEKPTAIELAESASALNLKAIVEEGKKHPRDFFRFGRVLIELRTGAAAALARPDIATKKILLTKLGEKLVSLRAVRGPPTVNPIVGWDLGTLKSMMGGAGMPGMPGMPGMMMPGEEDEEEEAGPSSSNAAPSSASSGKNKKKKKGK